MERNMGGFSPYALRMVSAWTSMDPMPVNASCRTVIQENSAKCLFAMIDISMLDYYTYCVGGRVYTARQGFLASLATAVNISKRQEK